jgi:beta-1,4-mannosyltransferase
LSNKSEIIDKLNLRQNSFLIITSTSWTPDEDLQILLHTVDILDKMDLPVYLEIIITGRGPMRYDFEK